MPVVRADRGASVRVVYEAAHVIDAHLVRHALEAAGMPAFIRGEALLGGLGELGVFGLIAVCVPEPCWPEARAVVESLSLGNPGDLDADDRTPHAMPWPCPA